MWNQCAICPYRKRFAYRTKGISKQVRQFQTVAVITESADCSEKLSCFDWNKTLTTLQRLVKRFAWLWECCLKKLWAINATSSLSNWPKAFQKVELLYELIWRRFESNVVWKRLFGHNSVYFCTWSACMSHLWLLVMKRLLFFDYLLHT